MEPLQHSSYWDVYFFCKPLCLVTESSESMDLAHIHLTLYFMQVIKSIM